MNGKDIKNFKYTNIIRWLCFLGAKEMECMDTIETHVIAGANLADVVA